MSIFSKRKTEASALHVSELRYTIGDKLNFAAAEAYKLLRTNIEFSLPNEKKCRIIGVTSGMRGEGKTTTAINLAYSFAQSGKRVLLLEADMRLPTIAKRLNIAGSPGLSNLLVGLCTGGEVLQESGLLPDLHVAVAGDIPPNPAELLGSEQMGVSVRALSENFDFIIMDLPPVNVVSDALVASKLVNGMIVVVRQDYSSRQSVSEAMRHLKVLDAKVLGFVMTHAGERNKSYQYKKYGKKYGYGYEGGYAYGHSGAGKRANRSKDRKKERSKETKDAT